MFEKWVKQFLQTPNEIGLGSVFFIAVFICVLLFVIGVLVRLFSSNIGAQKKIVFTALHFCVLVVSFSMYLLDFEYSWTEKSSLLLIQFVLSVLSLLPVVLGGRKSVKVLPEHKELILNLDEKIAETKPEINPTGDDDARGFDDESADEEINFSHVKNVLYRLKFYPLSQTEKSQINELALLIRRAEENPPNRYMQTEINEKLSALLKIMSKYSV